MHGRLVSSLAATAAALTMSACGAEDAAEKLDPVSEAASKTLASGGAEIDGYATMRLEGRTVRYMTIDGAVDFDEKRFQMKMDFTDQMGMSAKEKRKAGFPIDLRTDESLVYVNSPMLHGKLPDDKRWMKIDMEELAEDAVPGLDQLNGANESDPAAMLDMVKRAGSAKKVGVERVDNVRTTRYHAVVDVEKYVDRVSKGEAAKAKRALRKIAEAQGGSKFPMDLWIDDDGMVRREQVKMSETVEGEKIPFVVTIDFERFSRDVTVPMPDDGDAYDATDDVEKELEG